MLKHASRHRRPFSGALIALIGAWPGLAHADVPLPLPMPGMAACDAPDEPEIALPALADLDEALPRLLDGFDVAFNAQLIDNILKSVGDATRLAAVPAKPRATGPDAPFIIRTGDSTPSAPARANASFGAREGMAVSINPRLVSSGALNTDIRFSHTTSGLDAGFNLAAQQSLVTPDPMAMRYDGRALVTVGPTMQFGVAARGSLGTIGAPTLSGNEMAGPLLHLNLIDSNLSLVSDVGYDFGLNPVSVVSHNQFHAKLNLKLRL
jgi:hypothetical protein